MLRFLIFGDIVGRTGRQAVLKILPSLKKRYHPNLIVANAENLAHGTGVTPRTLADLEAGGINIFTGGDHIFAKPDAEKIFHRQDCPLLRPANWKTNLGTGEKVVIVAKKRVLVINLLGEVFIGDKLREKGVTLENPFVVVESILKRYSTENIKTVLVDFHTEATSEQVALGWFLDGKISCLWGTHTHIPTADAKILPQGTGYITDIGMSGAKDTVLGVDKKTIIERFAYGAKEHFDWPELDEAVINALYVEVSEKTGRTKKIELIQKEIKI